jgi:hypothetical protein
MKRIECPACGETALEVRQGPGRMMKHRLLEVEIPSDFPLPECGACGAQPIDWKAAKQLDPLLEKAYQKALSDLVAGDLDVLASVQPIYEWERDLGLSAGYLSKVRNEKAPSAQLVALVRLLANQPSRAREVADLWAGRTSVLFTDSVKLPGGAVSAVPKPTVHLRLIESGDWHFPERDAA